MSFVSPTPPPPVGSPVGPQQAPPTHPAGWYPDRHTPGYLQWWDGQNWAEQRMPIPAGSPYAPADPNRWTAVDYVVPTGRNSASGALFWGIFAQVANIALFLPGAIAIIMGSMGIAHAKALEQQGLPPKGRRMSIAGLVLGIIATATTAIGLIVLLVSAPR